MCDQITDELRWARGTLELRQLKSEHGTFFGKTSKQQISCAITGTNKSIPVRRIFQKGKGLKNERVDRIHTAQARRKTSGCYDRKFIYYVKD